MTTTSMMRKLAGTMLALTMVACGQKATLQELQLTPPEPTTAAGLPTSLRATAIYSDGSKRDVTAAATWTSGDERVATVSAGQVTTFFEGAVAIGARFESKVASVVLGITAAIPVALRASVVSGETGMPNGLNLALRAVADYSDGTTDVDVTYSATWSSLDGGVWFDMPGNAIGARVGPSLVTATLGQGEDVVSGDVALEVRDALLQAVTFSANDSLIPLGASSRVQMAATFTDGTTSNVVREAVLSASAADPLALQSPVEVAADGTITAVALGDAYVVAQYANESHLVAVSVTDAQLLSLRLAPEVVNVPLGTEGAVAVYGTFTDGERLVTSGITFSGFDAAIASIDNSPNKAGTVYTTRTAQGTTTFTALDPQTGISVDGTIVVGAPVLTSITVNARSITLNGVGDAKQLTVTGHYSDGSSGDVTGQVTYTVIGMPVVTVSQDGLVTATDFCGFGLAALNIAMPGVRDLNLAIWVK